VVEASHDEHETRDGLEALPQSDGNAASSGDAGDATETTPLVGGNGHEPSFGTTFANRYRQVAVRIFLS
jgi:hypothetical protein